MSLILLHLTSVILSLQLLSLAFEIYSIDTPPSNCHISNVTYENGERFEMGCTGVCKCDNGNVGCVSMCPPIFAPGCPYLRKPGECCRYPHCPEKLHESDCTNDPEHALPADFSPQWSLVFSTGTSQDNGCIATILDKRFAYVAPECPLSSNHVILQPPAGSKYKFSNAINISLLDGSKALLLQLTPQLEFLRTIHDTNRPDGSVCPRKDCLLFLTHFDANNNVTRLVTGQHADPALCNVTHQETSDGVRCINVNTTQINCLNVAGSGVLVKSGEIYFLTGFVVGQTSFSLKPNRRCSPKDYEYVKYQDECTILSAMTHDSVDYS